jgi:hypothetical protein
MIRKVSVSEARLMENSLEKKPAQEVTLDEALALAQGHHEAGNLVIADRTYKDILRAVPDHFPTTMFAAGTPTSIAPCLPAKLLCKSGAIDFKS